MPNSTTSGKNESPQRAFEHSATGLEKAPDCVELLGVPCNSPNFGRLPTLQCPFAVHGDGLVARRETSTKWLQPRKRELRAASWQDGLSSELHGCTCRCWQGSPREAKDEKMHRSSQVPTSHCPSQRKEAQG